MRGIAAADAERSLEKQILRDITVEEPEQPVVVLAVGNQSLDMAADNVVVRPKRSVNAVLRKLRLPVIGNTRAGLRFDCSAIHRDA